jgi:hypothetical protein
VGPDVTGLSGGDDLSGVQVAVKIKGDPEAIEKVLDKIRTKAGTDASDLGSDQAGDTVAVGPDADYRRQLLTAGRLGQDPVFRDVVPEASKASSILFVDLNHFDSTVEDVVGNDPGLIDNLEVVSGLGVAGWADGDTAHAMLRISTD